MAEITDVSKLRPELLDKSYKELQRMKSEIEMALASKEAEEQERKRAALVEEAGKNMDSVLEGLRWLNENKFLSEKVTEFFTANVRAKGKGKGSKGVVTNERAFLPHLFFRKPTK